MPIYFFLFITYKIWTVENIGPEELPRRSLRLAISQNIQILKHSTNDTENYAIEELPSHQSYKIIVPVSNGFRYNGGVGWDMDGGRHRQNLLAHLWH